LCGKAWLKLINGTTGNRAKEINRKRKQDCCVKTFDHDWLLSFLIITEIRI